MTQPATPIPRPSRRRPATAVLFCRILASHERRFRQAVPLASERRKALEGWIASQYGPVDTTEEGP